MKIVYICRSIIPSRTANSINVMKMCSAFASLGHEVTLLAPWTKKLEEKNINNIYEYYGVEENFILKKVFSPNIKYLKKRIYSLRCLSIVKEIKPDLVYGRDESLAFYLTQKNDFLTLFEKHEPLKEKEKFLNYFFHKFIQSSKTAKLVTISDALKTIYQNSYNIDPNSILVAHSGTNKIPNNDIPENIKLDSSRVQVGYIGSLLKGKGVEIIVELAKEMQNVDFHIIGGNQKDLDFWKTNRSYTNLIFHGFVSPKETYKYRNMCDILLAPYQSNKEGNRLSEFMSPIKLFEYMASKKAIICSDFKVYREVINEECAILVDYKNITQWKDAINNLINDKDKKNRLAQNGYEIFLENYTWKKRAQNIIDFALIK